MTTPAAAEVCDKVRPAWNPAKGPINQFEDMVLFLKEPLGLFVLVVVLMAILLCKAWFTAVALILLFATIVLLFSTWIRPDDITTLAVAEGCITMPVLKTVTLLAMCAIIVVMTLNGSQSQKRGR